MRKVFLAALVAIYYLGGVFSFIMFFLALGFSLNTRFANPELTETQLFLKCWGAYLMCVGFGFTSLLYLTRDNLDIPWKKSP